MGASSECVAGEHGACTALWCDCGCHPMGKDAAGGSVPRGDPDDVTPQRKPILLCVHGKIRCGTCREAGNAEQLDAEQARTRWGAYGYGPDQIAAMLRDPKTHLAAADALWFEERAPDMAPGVAVLRAYVAWLDANGEP